MRARPHLPVIVVEDGLSSNAPHIRELQKHGMKYILVVKEGDHPFLIENVRAARGKGQTTEVKFEEKGVIHQFSFLNQTPLNKSNQDLLVNFVEYWQIHPNSEVQPESWVTDFVVTKRNVKKIMSGGREVSNQKTKHITRSKTKSMSISIIMDMVIKTCRLFLFSL